jgi:hypothetical protein
MEENWQSLGVRGNVDGLSINQLRTPSTLTVYIRYVRPSMYDICRAVNYDMLGRYDLRLRFRLNAGIRRIYVEALSTPFLASNSPCSL